MNVINWLTSYINADAISVNVAYATHDFYRVWSSARALLHWPDQERLWMSYLLELSQYVVYGLVMSCQHLRVYLHLHRHHSGECYGTLADDESKIVRLSMVGPDTGFPWRGVEREVVYHSVLLN